MYIINSSPLNIPVPQLEEICGYTLVVDFDSLTISDKDQTQITLNDDIKSKLTSYGISIKESQSQTLLEVESSNLDLSDTVVEITLKSFTEEEPTWFLKTTVAIYFTQPDCIAIQKTFATIQHPQVKLQAMNGVSTDQVELSKMIESFENQFDSKVAQ